MRTRRIRLQCLGFLFYYYWYKYTKLNHFSVDYSLQVSSGGHFEIPSSQNVVSKRERVTAGLLPNAQWRQR